MHLARHQELTAVSLTSRIGSCDFVLISTRVIFFFVFIFSWALKVEPIKTNEHSHINIIVY
jgi:hypothetical protein